MFGDSAIIYRLVTTRYFDNILNEIVSSDIRQGFNQLFSQWACFSVVAVALTLHCGTAAYSKIDGVYLQLLLNCETVCP